jgi:hypothetical protein
MSVTISDENYERMLACGMVMRGIPDPQRYREAASALAEAAERCDTLLNPTSWGDVVEARHLLDAASEAFRAAERGEP